MLFRCKCALFLFDATRNDSFILIKDFINIINISKYVYLKIILVLNKSDLKNREITEVEIMEYMQSNKKIDFIEITVKNSGNLEVLLNKTNNYLNQSILPVNLLSESLNKTITNNFQALSFILVGNSSVGKTCFLSRYFKNEYREFYYPTTGCDREIKYFKYYNNIYKCYLWDAAGAVRFRDLPKKVLSKC